MAYTIDIRTGRLTETAGTVRRLNERLTGDLEKISTTMQKLESSWKSNAAEEIRTNMQGTKNKFFDHYQTVVESYAKFLEQTAQSYESTEQAVQTNAQSFK